MADYTWFYAGIPPNWSIKTAVSMAREVEDVLQSDRATEYFQAMYGNQPDSWSEDLEGPERWRVITNYLTRMRFCTSSGQLELKSKMPPTKSRIAKQDKLKLIFCSVQPQFTAGTGRQDRLWSLGRSRGKILW